MNDIVFMVMSHPLMLRLKHIEQLGILFRALDKKQEERARYSRYDHCIGVSSLGRELVLHLRLLSDNITLYHVFVVQIAGLLHDVGHGPMSHVFDRWVADFGVDIFHEERSCDMVRTILGEVYRSGEGIPGLEVVIKHVTSMILGKDQGSDFPKCLQYVICSNSIDVVDLDRLDYILRDDCILFNKTSIERASIRVGMIYGTTVHKYTKMLIWPEPNNTDMMLTRKRLHMNLYSLAYKFETQIFLLFTQFAESRGIKTKEDIENILFGKDYEEFSSWVDADLLKFNHRQWKQQQEEEKNIRS